MKTRIKKSGKKVVQEREIEIEREQKIMRKRERESFRQDRNRRKRNSIERKNETSLAIILQQLGLWL